MIIAQYHCVVKWTLAKDVSCIGTVTIDIPHILVIHLHNLREYSMVFEDVVYIGGVI